jgi:hypothetical protein
MIAMSPLIFVFFAGPHTDSEAMTVLTTGFYQLVLEDTLIYKSLPNLTISLCLFAQIGLTALVSWRFPKLRLYVLFYHALFVPVQFFIGCFLLGGFGFG